MKFDKKEYMRAYYKSYYAKHKKRIQKQRIVRLKVKYGNLTVKK